MSIKRVNELHKKTKFFELFNVSCDKYEWDNICWGHEKGDKWIVSITFSNDLMNER